MKTACASSRQHFALLQPTEWTLSLDSTIKFDLEPGDIVRGCHGLVWATVDGLPDDIMLAPGDIYEVPQPQRMRFNGFGAARMVVLARSPIVQAQLRMPWNQAITHWASALLERWFVGGRWFNA